MRHFYGYLKDKQDLRDYWFHAPQKIEQLPPSMDLRYWCSAVRDQESLGACTGFSIASGLREFLAIKSIPPVPPDPDPVPIPVPVPSPEGCLTKLVPRSVFRKLLKAGLIYLSPLFLYYQERVYEGTVQYDSGAEMRDGMKTLGNFGVCPEVDWEYNIRRFAEFPGTAAYKTALAFRVSAYTRITSLQDLKSALAIGNGCSIGFNVYESFESEVVAKTGVMPMPKTGEALLGGHAVFVCGYMDDTTWAGGGYLIVKNSWGVEWGDKGYFYMPYAFAANPIEVSDIWTATI